jgi:hypothetical protein
MYGQGIAHEGELIDLGVKLDLVQKAGSWFSMGETRIGQGRDAAKSTCWTIQRWPSSWRRTSARTSTSS